MDLERFTCRCGWDAFVPIYNYLTNGCQEADIYGARIQCIRCSTLYNMSQTQGWRVCGVSNAKLFKITGGGGNG
jgi:hypothetical protein